MAETAQAVSGSPSSTKKPVVVVTIGMAGSGKTTFVQRMNSYLHSQKPPQPPYILNLDPAVPGTPFEPSIDIRDTVNYKEVMKQLSVQPWDESSESHIHINTHYPRYNLGPNGGILTALNLFTTKFDQVLGLIEKRAENLECVCTMPLTTTSRL